VVYYEGVRKESGTVLGFWFLVSLKLQISLEIGLFFWLLLLLMLMGWDFPTEKRDCHECEYLHSFINGGYRCLDILSFIIYLRGFWIRIWDPSDFFIFLHDVATSDLL